MTEKRPSLEHCAARALDLWVRKEKALHKGLTSPTAETVRPVLAFYRVSRGFKGIGKADSQIASEIAALLIQSRTNRHTAPELVVKLENQLRELTHSDKGLTSAASKLLWVQGLAPFKIYDRQARDALKILGIPVPAGNYKAFFSAWEKEYAKRQADIDRAVQILPEFRRFTAASHWSVAAISATANSLWFKERVFDQYLWLIGDRAAVGEEG